MFLDKGVVDIGRLLDKLVIVVSVIPDIELAVEWVPLLRVLFLLQCEQALPALESVRSQFVFEVTQKQPSRNKYGFWHAR